jgi:hypothetical protein
MVVSIVWLTAKNVQAACPPPMSLTRVRQLMKVSGLAHRSGNRLYLRADRLEQFLDEAFAYRLHGPLKPRGMPKRAKRPGESAGKEETGSEIAARLATGVWRTAGAKK